MRRGGHWILGSHVRGLFTCATIREETQAYPEQVENPEVRRIRPDDWEGSRRVRLAALLDSSDAYSATYAQAAALTDQVWIDRALVGSEGSTQATFLVVDNTPTPRGMVTGLTDLDEPSSCQLVSLWVEPELRRQGFGLRLTEALTEWATAQAFDKIHLWVTVGNSPAAQLYQANGFVCTGHTQSLAANPDLNEARYEKRLRPEPSRH